MNLQHKIRVGETTLYVDAMSLYPYICKYFKLPVGHPIINLADECLDKETMFQKLLIKCSIVHHKRLYHPVLPLRCNKRLLICLRQTCATEQSTETECAHKTVANWPW